MQVFDPVSQKSHKTKNTNKVAHSIKVIHLDALFFVLPYVLDLTTAGR